jgi:Valyl-tRNA synthetase
MIMAGMEFMHEIPFKDVYIHGTVRDEKGLKMSKSLGNSIDPLEIIDEYGTDALRYSLISTTATGTDVFLSKEKFELGRNFANKIWNASRLILMNFQPKADPPTAENEIPKADLCQIFQKENFALPERWILSRLYSTIEEVDKEIKGFRFNEAANSLYEFFWHEFCDWYLEIIKLKFSDNNTQIVSFKVLEKFLRLIHPVMPFISEEIWQKINPQSGPIMIQPLPHIQKQMIDKKIEQDMKLLIGLITSIRNVRAEWNVDPYKKVDVILKVTDAKTSKLLDENSAVIKNLCRVENLSMGKTIQRPSNSASGVAGRINFYVPLSNLIDIEKEKSRILTQIKNKELLLKGLTERLKNKDFLKKAPKEVVEKENSNLIDLKEKIKKLKDVIGELI